MITVDAIKATVCRHYQMAAIDMVSARRSRDVARPRQLAMYLSRKLTPLSLPAIGQRFGKRDHTTVHHAISAVQDRIANDEEFANLVKRLSKRIKRRCKPVHIVTDGVPSQIEPQPHRDDLWLIEDVGKLANMARDGFSAKDIGCELGRTDTAVRNMASRAGITLRRQGGKKTERIDQEYRAFMRDAISGSALLRDAILRLVEPERIAA